MSHVLYDNHLGSPTLTSLNVLGVLGALIVLNVLHVLNLLNVLNMPMDASLACWASFKLNSSFSDLKKTTLSTDRPTDRRTDRPSYGDALTHLKSNLFTPLQFVHISQMHRNRAT